MLNFISMLVVEVESYPIISCERGQLPTPPSTESTGEHWRALESIAAELQIKAAHALVARCGLQSWMAITRN
jgi:hypothetical protein